MCHSNSHLFESSSCLTTSLQPLIRSIGPQSGTQSSSWRTTTKPSTPPSPAANSIVSSKQTSVSSVSSSKPSTSDSIPGSATSEMDKMRSRNQGTDKVYLCHSKWNDFLFGRRKGLYISFRSGYIFSYYTQEIIILIFFQFEI